MKNLLLILVLLALFSCEKAEEEPLKVHVHDESCIEDLDILVSYKLSINIERNDTTFGYQQNGFTYSYQINDKSIINHNEDSGELFNLEINPFDTIIIGAFADKFTDSTYVQLCLNVGFPDTKNVIIHKENNKASLTYIHNKYTCGK